MELKNSVSYQKTQALWVKQIKQKIEYEKQKINERNWTIKAKNITLEKIH